MKTIFYIFLFLLLFTSIDAQVVTQSKLNVTNIPKYNKITGEKISNDDYLEIIMQSPNVYSEPEIDKFGKVEAVYIDPTKSGKVNARDTSLRVKQGEKFPPFVMKSMDGEKLNSEIMKGNYILIYAELFVKPPFFNEDAFSKAVELVDNFRNKSEIRMILLTERPENDIDKKIIQSNSDLKIVPNARNFMLRYIITEYPGIILIDKQGNLVSYYGASDIQKLEKDLNE